MFHVTKIYTTTTGRGFDLAADAACGVIYSHPDLHYVFLASLYMGEQDRFTALYLRALQLHRNDRAWRLGELARRDPFLSDKTRRLSDPAPAVETLDRLFALSWDDPRLVEKSYYLLENVISFYKGEGQREIVQYVEAHPELVRELEARLRIPLAEQLVWQIFKETHKDADLTLDRFDEKFTQVNDYCRKYRGEAYSFIGMVRSASTERLRKKIAKRILDPWM